MDKRKLSKVPREAATDEMIALSGGFEKINHIVTVGLLEEQMIMMSFYKVSDLKKGKREAVFRTFLSDSDYITQDLRTSKTKWLTSSFERMNDLQLYDAKYTRGHWKYIQKIYIRSDEEVDILKKFFKGYKRKDDKYEPWVEIFRFQTEVKEKRLEKQHRKVTDRIDKLMESVKDVPEEFFSWVWQTGMSFSRYLIYETEGKDKAKCECTHCKTIGTLDRNKIRLRNNEKGICPFCGSSVTIKAKGRMPGVIRNDRTALYVDPTEEGFILRYFKANRYIGIKDSIGQVFLKEDRVEEKIYETKRVFYELTEKKEIRDSYIWDRYKKRGPCRWCPEEGGVSYPASILYPGNLPKAWEHTRMKYSALELLAKNIPTVAVRFEMGIKTYRSYPFLEWLIKMGLNNIAKEVLEERFGYQTGKIKKDGKTIWEIIGLNKVNTRVLQQIDGNYDELRLLQVAEKEGMQLKPEQLKEYYEVFGCNTNLLHKSERKVSLHKLSKYIIKESENYPIGEEGSCWRYSFMSNIEREDVRFERMRNAAKDWLEYLDWCREMKYDLSNMFIYMPKNFKKVHDRTAKEYQDFKDEKIKRKKKMMEKKIKEVLKEASDDPAIMMETKGLELLVPKDAEEIREEGRVLHHCVGTYVERVAKGETMILFVRRKKRLEEPYFTMEFKEGKVVQCRGKNNCGMPKDVKAFVDEFERKMNQKDKRLEVVV